ncbi:MAG: tetratricopeptide repeat protein [Muribaculaceae bacterium]|nr:tetratricopeptide repeat protein [Muribaculaceae bacterium]
MIKLRILPLLLLVAVCGLMLGADAGSKRKARQIYAAGVVAEAEGHEDRAYDYFKRAYELDTSYVEAAYAYGSRRVGIGLDTLQTKEEMARSLAMMRRYIEKYPADLYESQMYGYIASQLGNVNEAAAVLEKTYILNPDASNILVDISEVYSQGGDLLKAVDALNRYEVVTGVNPAVTMRKISMLLASNDTLGAIREADRLIESEPSQAAFLVMKGNVYDVINKPDSAFQIYLQAEKLSPESGMAKLAIADHLRQNNDSVGYDAKMYEVLLCEDLGLEQKTDLTAHYLQTLLTDGSGTARGDTLFSVLARQYPHEPRVLDLAARYNAAKGDLKTAVEKISYAIDQDPANISYWQQLMMYQASQGEYQEAIDTYARAKEHLTPDAGLKGTYASLAMTAGMHQLAQNTFAEMITDIDPGLRTDTIISLKDLNPKISLAQLDRLVALFTSLGDSRHEASDTAGAYQAYDNALTLDPDASMTLNNYAYFMSIDGGDLQKALELSQKVMQGRDAENPTYIDTYAWILHLLGRNEEAEASQLKAMKIMEESGYKSGELYDHLGDIYAALDKWVEATEAWQKAVQTYKDLEDSDDPALGKIAAKLKDAAPKAAKQKQTSEPEEVKE